MLTICPYFHVHQPFRIKKYRIFDIGNDHEYFNDESGTDLDNKWIMEKVANKSYIPTTEVLQELLDRHPEFKFALSFSGVVLDQMEEYTPDVLDRFKRLVDSGRVELLADTYHHSLAFFYSEREFGRQVAQHRKTLKRIFNAPDPKVFRHTELCYNNDLAHWAEKNGYLGIMAEGWDPVLGWRSPNYLYHPKGHNKIKVLLKNYRLSDDIAFRFGNKNWEGWPLSAEKYADWVFSHHGDGNTINLFMDFETFGEHQWEDTGIFDFMRELPNKLLQHPDVSFKTPSETIESYPAVGEIDVEGVLTWADTERDLTAWLGNDIQQSSIRALYDMEEEVMRTGDKELIEDWRRLQTSDHFYYMCTKWDSDGDVHKYFSPYESAYDAHIAFMNALNDMRIRLSKTESGNKIIKTKREAALL
jgi:alpha-amylase